MQATDFETKLKKFAASRLCILQDDSSAKRKSILVAPAFDLQASTMNQMLTLSKGLVFVALSSLRAESLQLEPMPAVHEDSRFPGSLVSVDAREGITTGISASDRALAVAALGAQKPEPRSIVRPGHIFPLTVRRGGVLVRNALPEGAMDLSLLIKQNDAAVFMDLLNSEGAFLGAEKQLELANDNDIVLFSLSEIVQHRLRHEPLVSKVAEATLPTRSSSEVKSYLYRSELHAGEHIALVKGDISPDKPTLTRVQTENTFSDVFGGDDQSSRKLLHAALQQIEEKESGVLLYLRRPLQGALAAQLLDKDTKGNRADINMIRTFGIGAQILRDLGVQKINLLSHHSKQLVGLDTFGLEIVQTTRLNI